MEDRVVVGDGDSSGERARQWQWSDMKVSEKEEETNVMQEAVAGKSSGGGGGDDNGCGG